MANMKKTKKELPRMLFVIIAVSVLLLTTSCSGSTPGSSWFGIKSSQTGQDDTPFTTRVYSGIYGVTMKFASNQPPRTVYYTGTNTPFDVILEIRNRGASPIISGYLYLTGFDTNIINPAIISPASAQYPLSLAVRDLEPVSNFNPEGGYMNVEFENTIRRWPPGIDIFEPKIRATS